MEGAKTKVRKVGHAKRPPEDGPQSVVEPLRPAIARTSHEIVGDLVQPVRQRLAEGVQTLQFEVWREKARKLGLKGLDAFCKTLTN